MTNDELRYFRGRWGLTQSDVAQHTGYSLSYIQKVEQGVLPITAEFKKRLYEAYNLESSFRRSYAPPKEKFDWGRVVLYIIFILFIMLFMVINK